MDASSPESKASSWTTRALIASAALLLVVNSLLSWVSTARLAPNGIGTVGDRSYQSARLLGAAFVTASIVGVVIGGARVTGHARTLASKAKIAVWTLVGLLVLNCSMISRDARSRETTTAQTDVTEAERQGLRVTADSVTHPLLGFAFPIAGANVARNLDLERQMRERVGVRREMVAWAFRDTARGSTLLVEATKLAQLNESRFRAFAAGMRGTVSKKSTFIDSTFVWRDSLAEFGLHAVSQAGAHIVVRCLARSGRLGIVCVETIAPDPEALEASRVGLRLVP